MPRLRSRFQGICTRCGRSYDVGTWIIWNPGQGSFHELCPASQVGAPTPTEEKWDQDAIEQARKSYEDRMRQLKGEKA